jgi:hypothetical protein
MTRGLPLRVLVLALAVAITGCQDPYARDRAEPASAPTAEPSAAPSHVSQPGPPPRLVPSNAAHRLPSARAAARSFATRWVNWDWRSAASQQRTLAHLATGDLARQLRANASSARIDATLARDKPGSRGSTAAIDMKTGNAEAAGIVVTREQTYTNRRADLGGRRYRVYLIHLKRDQDGWGVSAWRPQP